MPTGQQIIDNALTILGILGQGETPSNSDTTDALGELNSAWDAWGIDEGLIYAQISQRFPLTANIGQYTIGQVQAAPPLGVGAVPMFNAQRPSRIYNAYITFATGGAISTSSLGDGGQGYAVNDTGVILGASGVRGTYTVNTVDANGAVLTYTISGAGSGYLNGNGYQTLQGGGQPGVGVGFTVNILTSTAGGQNRTELKVVSAEQYYSHNDLAASASTADELYADFNVDVDGFARLSLWPVPNVIGTLEIETGVNFRSWTLADNYILPQGMQDPLQYALAYRLIPRYGMAVAQEIVQVVTGIATKAEERFRAMNSRNRQLQQGAAAVPVATPPPQAAAGR